MLGSFVPVAAVIVQERVTKVFAQRESLSDVLFRVSAILWVIDMLFASKCCIIIITDICRILVSLL